MSGACSSKDTPMEEARITPTQPMDVEESVVCQNIVSSGSLVYLHPLVAMSIADHATRCRINNRDSSHALGVLLGKQTGRDIEIMQTFDLCYDMVDGNWILNRDYLDNKLDQVSQIKPGENSWNATEPPQSGVGCDVVGWYALGTVPNQAHVAMHTQISQVNESPILLMFDPSSEKELSMKTYETIIDISCNQSRTVFVEIQYTVKTFEGERIGVDHAAGASVSGSSAVADVLGSHQSAIAMLNGRVSVICDYIKEVKAGHKAANPAVMRAIASLVSSLPLAQQHTQAFDHKSRQQLVDALMITSLATLTKGILIHDDISAKSSVIHSQSITNKKMKNLEMMTTFSRTLPL